MNIQISRRNVLLGSGALIVSFSLAGSMADAQVQGGTKPLTLTEVDSFLAIDGNGKVTVYSGKVDLGTGISTALRQIVAEELDVPIEHIELIQGDTLITPNQGTTWASVSVQVGGMQLRQASAAARQMLLSEAERRLGTGQLTVTEGVISGGGKKVSYGELVGGKNFAIKLDPKMAEAYAYRGALALSVDDCKQAIADCTRAIDLDARLASAYWTRAVAHGRAGDRKQAAADQAKAIELNPALGQ